MEKDLEAKVGRLVRRQGGLWLKWVSPGYTGVPDRIVVAPGGRVAFVEMKQAGGKLSARQIHVGRLLSILGCKVYTVFDMDDAAHMMREVFGDEVQAT